MKTKAMILNEYSPSAQFTLAEIEVPKLHPNQVLIEVEATSLNPVDNLILRGGAPLGPEIPSTLHGDVSGVVIATGSQVKKFKAGDQIFGIAGGVKGHYGASANHMIVNADLINHKPKTLTFLEAAALPLVFITAYEGLVDKAKIQSGQNLLVIGGAGGVGHQVVQLAKVFGANVTAVVSSEEEGKVAKSFGADVVINRKETPLSDYCKVAGVSEGFDIVFDTVGGANLQNDWELVRNNGQVVTTVSMVSLDLTPVHLKGISLHVVFMLLPMLTNTDQIRHQSILSFLKEKADEGKIRPLIDKKSFSLSQLNEAHSYYESGKHLGKIVIDNSQKI